MSEGLTAEQLAHSVVGETGKFAAGSPAAVPGGLPASDLLREARDEDSEAVIALIHAVWSEYPGKSLDVGRDMPELMAVESSYREWDGRFWVIERARRVVATVALKPSASPGTVELQKLYVDKQSRRHGLGHRLCGLVEAAAGAAGAEAVELWSDIKLLDAHRLYERLGYRRGADTRLYDDSSRTVRYYYRKALADGALEASGSGLFEPGGPVWKVERSEA